MSEEKNSTTSAASEDIRIVNKEKLRELLGIEELEGLVQKMGVKVDFTSEESGQALKEIAELKQRFEADILSKQKIGKRYFFLNDQLANMKSVLKESNELLMRFIHSTKTMNIDEPWKDIVESFKNELQQLLLKLEGSEKANMAEEGVKNPSMVIKRDNIPADSKEPSKFPKFDAKYGIKKELITDPCNPCIHNNQISCDICDYYIASHKKKPEFESKIIMDDGRVIPWSEYKKEKEPSNKRCCAYCKYNDDDYSEICKNCNTLYLKFEPLNEMIYNREEMGESYAEGIIKGRKEQEQKDIGEFLDDIKWLMEGDWISDRKILELKEKWEKKR